SNMEAIAVPDFWVFFKLIFIFIAILVGLRSKVSLGLTLILASWLLIMVFKVDFGEVFNVAYSTIAVRDSRSGTFITIELIIVLYLIGLLEVLMRKGGVFTRMIESIGFLARDPRKAAAFFPVFLGMLPSAGGARFSAPMVDEALKGSFMAQRKKGFANYWLRHIWEPVLPIYPGLIFASLITGVSMSVFAANQLPVVLFMLIAGWFVAFHKVPKAVKHGGKDKSLRAHILAVLEGVVPMAFLVLTVLFFKWNLILALLLTVLFYTLMYRFKPGAMLGNMKEALSWHIVVLIFGVMYFKNMLEISGAVTELTAYFKFANVPLPLIVFAMPFLVGLLTGVVQAYVGITFPLILPFITVGAVLDTQMLSFAFVSGYVGVMLSPVHLCFVLTCEYFKVELTEVYPLLLYLSPFLLVISYLVVFFSR
ncbi:MAG: DUF401 family protein, partial [Candidatus Firestonebacteria bacterium]